MDKKNTVLVVFGTRPEAIKMCPVVLELKKHKEIRTIVVVTGQHRIMLDQVLEIFGVLPDYDFSIMTRSQTLFDITERVMGGIREVLEKEQPKIVLVHGDTTTSMATALSAYYMNITVAHVEAGLRTYNSFSPYPEEFNRHAIGIISDLNFAPTQRAMDNLLKEGKKRECVWITGNTVIDALKTTVCKEFTHPELEWCKGKRLILITSHRRENIGSPMIGMFKAVERVLKEYDDVKAIFPVHPNPKVREICNMVFSGNEKIHLIEPLDVMEFHNFMNTSYLILTDSGGIQEEAPSMGKPVLVMRNTTERPEGIDAGTSKLIGTNEEDVYIELRRLLDDKSEYERMSSAHNPYGDGKASERIVRVILDYLGV